MTNLLRGRSALVSGAGGGIGRGIALALAAAGASVVVAARRKVTGDETVSLIEQSGGQAFCVETDISRRSEVESAVAAAVRRFSALDIVVHNANSALAGVPVALKEVDDDRLNDEAAIALDGAFFLARAAFPHLREHGRGRYVVLTSVEGMHGGSTNPVYAAVKAGQRGFVKALAREWGAFNILVNGINPAARTDSAEAYFARNPDARQILLSAVPLGRIGDARDDIGAAVVALCSDLMSYVTGQIINVNGGFYTAV